MAESSIILAVEALADEYIARKRNGEEPTIEEYCQQNPQLAEKIRELFPALEMMENLKPQSEDSFAGEVPSHPERIAGYRIIRKIARGGMGVVYEAEQEALGRRVALKLLPPHIADSPQLVERFKREAKAAAGLHHTNIVPVFEVGHDAGRMFYSMQLIIGRSLDHVIHEVANVRSGSVGSRKPVNGKQEGAASENEARSRSVVVDSLLTDRFSVHGVVKNLREEPSQHADDNGAPQSNSSTTTLAAAAHKPYYRSVARVGLQVAEALAYAHERRIIHRDIKPSNLLLDGSGVVWVTDFGLAKTEDDGLTQTGDLLGTVRYMAPERFAGECDPRADVYSLGLTLYEMLTLKPAFEASERMSLIDQIKHSTPELPRKLDPKVPKDLETIILRATDKEPSGRYASAKKLADDLQRFLHDEPIKARRHSAPELLFRWGRRNKPLATSLVGIFLLLVVLAAGTTWSSFHQAGLRAVAEQRGDELETQGEELKAQSSKLEAQAEVLERNLYLSQMVVAGQAADSRLGTMTIQSILDDWTTDRVGRDLRNWEWYYLHAFSNRASFVSEKLGNGYCWACDFSPDGDELVVTKNGWGIQVRDTETGKVLRDLRLGSARSVDWSPDGTRIAVGGFGDAVTIVDAASLRIVSVIRLPAPSEVFFVSWDPGSKRIAFLSKRLDHSGHNDVLIHDARTGARLHAIPFPQDLISVAWHPAENQVVLSTWDKTTFWDLGRGGAARELSRGGLVVFSDDGSTMIGLGEGQLWNLTTMQRIGTIDNAQSLCLSPDEQYLAIGCRDGKVRIIEIETGMVLRTLDGHTSEIESIKWNGQLIASCGLFDQTVRIWEIGKEDQNQILHEKNSVKASAWFKGGDRLVSVGHGFATVWDTVQGRSVHDHALAHQLEVWAVAIHPDGSRFAYGGRDYHGFNIWDLKTDRVHNIKTQDWIIDLDWHANGLLAVAFGTHAGLVDSSDQLSSLFTDHERFNQLAVAWNPAGTQFAGVTEKQTLYVVGTDGQMQWKVEGMDLRVTDVDWSRDGSVIATAHHGAILLWDARTGKPISQLDEIREAFLELAIHPDGTRIAAISDAGVSIWDTASGRIAMKLDPIERPQSVAWSDDGRKLVIGGSEKSIILDASPGYKSFEADSAKDLAPQ